MCVITSLAFYSVYSICLKKILQGRNIEIVCEFLYIQRLSNLFSIEYISTFKPTIFGLRYWLFRALHYYNSVRVKHFVCIYLLIANIIYSYVCHIHTCITVGLEKFADMTFLLLFAVDIRQGKHKHARNITIKFYVQFWPRLSTLMI